MLLFRSEAHIENWCHAWRLPRGGVLSLQKAWQLAFSWFRQNRAEGSWRRPTVVEIEALFAELGLTGEFWGLR